MFHLSVYDKDLIGVDPFDENLTVEMKSKVFLESTINIWYFLREVIKVPVPGGSVHFELHRGNLAMIFALWLNLDTAVELPRQHYKTYSAACYYLWLLMYSARNYTMIFSHKSHQDTVANLKRLTDMLVFENGCLPDYMLTPLNEKIDIWNTQTVTVKSNNNTIRTIGPANSREGADKSGRGMTSPIIWLDEMAFIKFSNVMYGSMRPAFTTASDFAKQSGTPYSVLITTTPSSLDLEWGKFTYQLIQDAAKWDEVIYDWYFENGRDFVVDFVEANSGNNFMYIEYNYKQLGKNDKWLKKMIKELNNDMSLVKREILLEWTYASSESVFDEETLDKLSRYADHDYVGKIILQDKYIMHMIRRPSNMLKKNWVIAIDIGGGLGRDKTSVMVIDPLDNKPIMIMYNNTITVPELIEVVKELVLTYMPNAVIVPERNYSGTVFIDTMLKDKRFEKNMFYTIRTRHAEKVVQDNKDILRPTKSRKVKSEVRVYGVDTTTKSRKIMIDDILYMIVNDNPSMVNNRDLFAEIRTLQKKKNGRQFAIIS